MTARGPTSSYEEKQIRCPKLGGPVTFSYCRVEDVGRPCLRAISCWETVFDAEGFFRESMSDQDFNECFSKRPHSKVATLIELIDRARKLTEEGRKDENHD
jgi:hypothetical protein